MKNARDILNRPPVRRLLQILEEQHPDVDPSKLEETFPTRPYWLSLEWIKNESLLRDCWLESWFVEAAYLFFCFDGINCGLFEESEGHNGEFAFLYNDRVWTQSEVCRGDLVPEYHSDPDFASMPSFYFIVTSINEMEEKYFQ